MKEKIETAKKTLPGPPIARNEIEKHERMTSMKRLMMSLTLCATLALGAIAPQQAQAGDEAIGTIIGAVGGGLLGSTIGKGDGRIVGAAAGTVIGAVLGREIATRDYDRQPTYEPRRVVYRDPPRYERPRTRVIERRTVVYREVAPRHEHQRWERAGRYGDEVLVCNKNARRCHWYD